MKASFSKVAIIGVGLMGGSLGLALLSRGLAGEVTGCGSQTEDLRLAMQIGAVNSYTGTPAAAVKGAELVVLATPVSAIVPVLESITPYLMPGAVITDVGSTKAGVVRQAERILPAGFSFVGGHPMTGSEQAGVKGADPYLFENAYYIITPTRNTAPAALKTVRQLAEGVGSRVVEMDPEKHDLAVAAVSHLPHLLASALVNTVARLPESERFMPLAAGGFRDTTRIAAGNPVMWRDIFLTNREQLLYMLRCYKTQLDMLEKLIEQEDGDAIEEDLSLARQIRSAIPAKTKGYLPRLYEVVVTVPDRPGVIAGLAAHLAVAGVNICDIEILRVREGEGGTIKIGFATESEQDRSVEILEVTGYIIRKR